MSGNITQIAKELGRNDDNVLPLIVTSDNHQDENSAIFLIVLDCSQSLATNALKHLIDQKKKFLFSKLTS